MSEKPIMQTIPPASLHHLPTRISYLRSFISFTASDAAALHAAAPFLAPLIPTVIDTVYTKLLSYSITASAFVPRQTGYQGATPTTLSDLSLTHPQIQFRKDFLAGYIKKLVTLDYEDPKTWEYLDKVGLMHTGVAGFKHREKKPGLRVEYVHCGILLGFVEDVIVNAVLGTEELDERTKTAVVRAVNKILWIQNDLFARHYVTEEGEEKKAWLVGGTCGRVVEMLAAAAVGAVVAWRWF